jgi:hypothetical protein
MNEIINRTKIIIPLSPKYIVDKVRIYFLEASWHQVAIAFTCIVLTTIIIGALPGWPGIALDIIGLLLIWGSFYKFAWTNEKYLASKSKLYYQIRKLRKQNTYSATASSIQQINKLYPYNPKHILDNGIIDFGNNRYGLIIDCQTRPIDAEDLPQQSMKISGFLKSLQDKTLLKIRVSSHIPYVNPVEASVTKQISEAKTHTDKALLYSMYDMSSKAEKAPLWNIKIFIAVESNEKQISTYLNTLLPGLLDRLQASSTIATVLTNQATIYKNYTMEGTSQAGINNKSPALFGDKAVWNETIRQIMQGSVIEYPDYVLVNHREYVGCLSVGVPVGGVAGFPPTISPVVLEQLYRISASSEHIIRIDYSIYPIASSIALSRLKSSISKLLKNDAALEASKTSQYDLGLDIEDLKTLYAQVKDGTENIFDCNIVVSVFSPSYEKLQAGLSKVSAILNAFNISNQIPSHKILDTIKASQFYPFYDDSRAIWLPASGLSQILPITQGANNITSTEGLYFGNDCTTGQEILIDLNRLGAQHSLLIGSSQSGKTTELGLTGIRTVLAGQDYIYITNKPDWNTSYLRPAEYFKDRSQIINIGRQPDGTCLYNINPFEIMFNDNVLFDPLTKFYEHIDFAKLFLNLLLAQGSLTDVQKGYLHETVLRLYAKFGFDPSDKKTWKPAKQPTPENIYDMWESDYAADPKNTTIQAILIRATGFKNTLLWLSNPTNVNLTAQYTVIDLSAVPPGAQEAANYLLINVLKLRFNPKSKTRTTIAFDECGVFLKQKELQDQLSIMLKQSASFRIRIILGSQMLEDLSSIGAELRSNIYVSKVFGLNIAKNIDNAVTFFKFTPSDKKFLIECSKPGMAAVQVGHPYATTYHLQTVLSELEAKILFGKQEQLTAYSFVHPSLESFFHEQGVVFADMVTGDLTELKEGKTAIWQQRPIGAGKVYAYVKDELIENGMIGNQNPEHFLSVCYLASWLLERGISCQVNHYEDADLIAQFPDGSCAFEWQSSGHNDIKNLMKKRQNSESKYGRMFFVGSSEACQEMRTTLQDDKIVISRGKQLESLLKGLMGEHE